MVAVVNPVQRRLSTQTAEIAPDTVTIRSLDWDRDRFDIEFGLQNGTTYNSFLIFGDKTALVDTSHEKFRDLYLDVLRGAVDPATIDYLIISHTEPDHSGLVPDVLALAPEVTVVGSKVALQFLEGLTHTPFKQKLSKMATPWIWARGISCSLSWLPTYTGPTPFSPMMPGPKPCLPVMPLACTIAAMPPTMTI